MMPDPPLPSAESGPTVIAERLEQEIHGTANTMVGDHNTLLTLHTENPEVASQFARAYLGHKDAPLPISAWVPTPIILEDDLLPRAELQMQVERALKDAAGLIVTGPPGMGKSTLLQQLAVQRGGLYLEAGRKSATRLARQLLAALDPKTALPQELDATLDAIDAVLHASPRLLLIDLGDGTEDIITHLGQLENRGGLVFAAATYPRGVPPSWREFRLPPLTEQEIRAWLTFHHRTLPPGQLIQLVERSAGHPLYIRAYLKLEEEALSPNLENLEAHLWRQSDELTQDILALAALSYRPLGVTEMTDLLHGLGRKGVTPADVMGAIARSQGLIESTGGHLAPFHTHFGAFVETHLDAQGASHSYHRQLAEQALKRADDLASSYHLLKTHDGRLRDVAERGGLEAFTAGDWELASKLLGVAEEEALRDERLGDAGRAALSQASVLTVMHLARAQEAAQRATIHFGEAGDTEGVMAARVFQNVLKINTLQSPEGLSELEAAQQHFRTHPLGDVRVQGMLDVNLSFAYIHAARFKDGMAAAKRGAEALGGAGDEFGKAIALQNYSGCAAKLGKLDEAQRTAEELIERAASLGQPRWAAAGHNTLTIVYRKRGDPIRAEQHAREAVRLSQQLSSVMLQALNLASLGNTFMDQDRIDEAETTYQEALGLLGETPGQWPDQVAHLHELVARIRMEEGQWEEALTLVQGALGVQRGLGDALRIATLSEKLSAIQAHAGQWAGAAQSAEESAQAYAAEFPSDTVNRWSEAAVLWAETPEIARSLQAVRNAFVAAYPESEGEFSAEAAELLSMLIDHEDGHFLMLLLRSVTRWATKHGDRDMLVELTRSLRDHAVDGHALASAGLAFVIADGNWDLPSLQQLAADLERGRPHLHLHDREDGSGVWTIGVQTSPPFVVQIHGFTETPDVQAVSLALALLLATQSQALNAVRDRYPSWKQWPDAETTLVSQQDQEEYFSTLDLGQRLVRRYSLLVMVEDGPTLCVLSHRWTEGRAQGEARYGRSYSSLVIDQASALIEASGIAVEEQEQATRHLVRRLLP